MFQNRQSEEFWSMESDKVNDQDWRPVTDCIY